MTVKARARDLISFREEVSCLMGCPINTDCGMYVQHAAKGNFAEGYRVARSPNPFASSCGRVCAAPCEDNCRRGKIGNPVTIRAIKKFLCENYGPESETKVILEELFHGVPPQSHQQVRDISKLKKIARNNQQNRIAVIGAGPAGLSCAHDLALLGYSVTVFEASNYTGGMMRLGIPSYRLPDSVLDKEVELIESLGVEIKLNHSVTGLKSLLDEGYKAVFIGVGAMSGRSLKIEGAETKGVHVALDYLVESNKGIKRELGKRVVVIGGGLVALDAAREALRNILEAKTASGDKTIDYEVSLACLESLAEMPSNLSTSGRQELEETHDEGIQILTSWGPNRIIGENGKVKAIELVRVLRVFDENGRFNPQFDKNNLKTIECDSVVLAVGQASELSFIKEEDSVEITPRGTIKIDPENFMTSQPGIFCGGDVAFGPRNLIDAVANGKKSALAIDSYLTGIIRSKKYNVSVEILPTGSYRMIEDYEKYERKTPPMTPPPKRVGLQEVELSYDEATVKEQAARCLTCHTSPIYDGNLCILCGRCTDICPQFCLSFIPFNELEVTNASREDIARRSGADTSGEMTVMVKDDEKCIRCGLCATRCPTGAMSMERVVIEELPYTV